MNIIPLSNQEIFDKSAQHLLTQNRPSVNALEHCAYRGEDGLMCAAGIFIPDEMYSAGMEGKSWSKVVERFPSLCQVGSEPDHGQLIRRLQGVHDDWYSREWADRLRYVARSFNLSDVVVDKFSQIQK